MPEPPPIRGDDGYVSIRDYAVIGDGRTAALVARDGSIDWLCLPNFDSPAVFSRLLDARRGGCFRLEPVEPFEAERRYRPGSNVLETTFTTDSGAVRVTDAMTFADRSIRSPLRELVRRVDGLRGKVPMRWRLEPRFSFGRRATTWGRRQDRLVALGGRDALALGAWDVGEPNLDGSDVEGMFTAEERRSGILQLAAAHQEPLVLVGRGQAEAALERTDAFWRTWSGRAEYDGPWRELVVRSALVLKSLVFSPSGAIIAAPTTSLPEQLGGERNWDYRFTWVRDATWTLDALLGLGYREEAHAFFWWIMHASRLTQPRLSVLYKVDGDDHARELEVETLEGYRRSAPVRVGNGAVDQLQLDIYGSMLDAVWRYAKTAGRLDRDTGKETAKIADYVAGLWRHPDSGIWEARSGPTHYTQSKAMCRLALDRASRLGRDGMIPDRSARWTEQAEAVRVFYEEHGWDDEKNSFVRAPGLRELDASLLMLSLLDIEPADSERMLGTIEAVERELARGPYVYRYRGEDGLRGEEGAFLACSFWLVAALARAGRVDDAVERFQQLADAANDVGLYAEEIDPASGEFLGNFPQGLTHLALVNAALTIAEVSA